VTLAEELAAWALGLRPDDIPDAAKSAARRHLLDGMGNALAAIRLGEASYALAVGRRLGDGDTPVLGTSVTLAAHAAAFVGGTLVHALDFDDTHAGALVHPTAVLGPTALAVGHEVGADDAEVLVALIAGHEVLLRIGAAVPHGFHARGFHATSVCGVFGAALVAARLRGLDLATTVHALGIAGSQAAGSLEFLATPASTKQLHPGWAAFSGILAVEMAMAGATGPATILEGTSGFFRAYADRTVAPDLVVAGLSEHWEVQRITIKPYPACQLSHASLDALDAALGSAGSLTLTGGDVAEVEVDLPEDSMGIVGGPLEEKARPRSPYEAKFSLPWCLAARMLDGAVGLDTFLPDSVAREDVAQLARRVKVVPFRADVPPASAPGAVRVRLADGRQLTGEVASSRGTPDSPLDDTAVRAKFDANLGKQSAADGGSESLARAVGTLGCGTGPREILAAARAAASSTITAPPGG
jgi:2-methylcitrate dehydratase PrpD